MRRLLSLALLSWSSLHAFDAVYLTLQDDPASSMRISWLSDEKNGENLVQFKKEKADEWQKKEATHFHLPQNVPYNLHYVDLAELEPETIYSFQLPGEEAPRKFSTMPKTLEKSSVRFAVGGDIYPNELAVFEEMAKTVATTNPHFVLMGGDLAYSVSEKKKRTDDFSRWLSFLTSWTKTMKDAKGCHIPIVAGIGNHEVLGYFSQTPEQAKFYYSLFSPTSHKSYRALCCGDYLVILLLDSNHTHPIAGEQTEWLKKELSESLDYSHCFAIYHVPAFPSVRYFRSRESSSIRRHWVPLFEKYHVSAVFENHDHAYKRTYPLIDGAPASNGVVYFGDGSWGAKPRIPKKASRTTYLAKTASRRQFLLVELHDKKRTYTALTAHDHVIDKFEQYVGKPSAIP